MLKWYVRISNALDRVRREQDGLTAIEYGVFAAFIVLTIAVMAFTIGPRLSDWINTTLCRIMAGSNTASGGC